MWFFKKKKEKHIHKPMFNIGDRLEYSAREQLGGMWGAVTPRIQAMGDVGICAICTDMKFMDGHWYYLLGGKGSGEWEAGWFKETRLWPYEYKSERDAIDKVR
ncbi:hypothetical protein AMJ86_01095 [bacterium SM23_57]|nr:MAG: hypothetical protein AMJ86_01095 [bacterium SM23_57]